MTDAPRTDDERDELASAYLDGEATPAERALVEGDPDLQARVAAMAEVRASLQAAPAPAPPATDQVAAALDAARAPGGLLASAEPRPADAPEEAAVVPLAARRGEGRRLRYLAVAAAVVVAALAVPLLGRVLDQADDQAASIDVAGRADDAREAAGADGAGEAADTLAEADADAGAALSPGASQLAATDLGAHPDLDALLDAVDARLQAQEVDAGAASTVAIDGATTTTAAACAGEVEVPAGHEVTLTATATVDGVGVVVVVHRAPAGRPTVVVADAETCEVLSARPR